MSNKKYYSYVRVSTARQGQLGTSLTEQQAAIETFARNWNLPITKRFEERETAAKQGRPVFLEMLKELKQRKANGVIIHKIDRSARNLKDWADLGSLIDLGLEVHFAAESLDLNSRGGRLSADIQAVVASDYIRNLREETKKGIYGRLKQGLYPFRAMIGYLDKGPGKPKEIDPVMGPLIRKAFELYATGDWSIPTLTKKMNSLGLRNKYGKKITLTGLATILHSPFYMGLIKIHKTGQVFSGVHKPIISRKLFDEVQGIFAGKNFKTEKHLFFVFRRMVTCGGCGKLTTPETQKGFTYYRCRRSDCVRRCLNEDDLSRVVKEALKKIEFSDEEYELLKRIGTSEVKNLENQLKGSRLRIETKLSRIQDRSSRLADALVDGVFDQETYSAKKNELVVEELDLRHELDRLARKRSDIAEELEIFFQLAKSAYLSYISASAEDKRDLVKKLTANITWDGEKVLVKLKKQFDIVAECKPYLAGCPYRGGLRTVPAFLSQLFEFFSEKANEGELRDMGLTTQDL